MVLSYAQAACRALERAMQADPAIVVLGEDVGRGGIFGQYAGLQAQFGAQRVIDTPISEATIMGAGVGMALAGLRPVVEMRVIDFALCAMDEIVNQAAKNRYMFGGQGRVPLVARMPIGMWSASAAQHSQSFEAWFAHLPGVVVVCPSTPQDNHDLLLAALDCGDPVIYMEHKELWPLSAELQPAGAATLGQARRWREGKDLTIVSWSRQMHWAAEAAQTLFTAHESGVAIACVAKRLQRLVAQVRFRADARQHVYVGDVRAAFEIRAKDSGGHFHLLALVGRELHESMGFRRARQGAELFEMELEPEFAPGVREALLRERNADARRQSLGEVVVEAARGRIRRGMRHAERVPAQARFDVARQVVERTGELRHAEP